jgi:hypothetical protein
MYYRMINELEPVGFAEDFLFTTSLLQGSPKGQLDRYTFTAKLPYCRTRAIPVHARISNDHIPLRLCCPSTAQTAASEMTLVYNES